MSAQPDQRDPAWFAARVGRITASRVAAILGCDPYRKPDDVLEDMVRDALGEPGGFTGNVATRWGEDHEADAIADYESATGVLVEPVGLIVHPTYSWLAASPDGLVGDRGMLECKCPFRARYMTAPEHYREQMQFQLECADRDWVDFAIWRAGEPLVIERHERVEGWLDERLDRLLAFLARYREALAARGA